MKHDDIFEGVLKIVKGPPTILSSIIETLKQTPDVSIEDLKNLKAAMCALLFKLMNDVPQDLPKCLKFKKEIEDIENQITLRYQAIKERRKKK